MFVILSLCMVIRELVGRTETSNYTVYPGSFSILVIETKMHGHLLFQRHLLFLVLMPLLLLAPGLEDAMVV